MLVQKINRSDRFICPPALHCEATAAYTARNYNPSTRAEDEWEGETPMAWYASACSYTAGVGKGLMANATEMHVVDDSRRELDETRCAT